MPPSLAKSSFVYQLRDDANRWDEKSGLQRDALSSQVIDALEAHETRRPAKEPSTTGLRRIREGRWVVADLYGKGGRLRMVPVPGWCKALIDRWLRASGVSEGLVFRRIWRNRTELSRGIAPDVVWTAVKRYAKRIGVDHLAPHDVRRTCARLCHGAGGELEQIQFLLGHASVQTTERYIGCRQRFKDAVNDRFQISLASRPR